MAEPCLVGGISFEAARVFSDIMCFSLFCLFSLREESTENCCGFLLAFLLNKPTHNVWCFCYGGQNMYGKKTLYMLKFSFPIDPKALSAEQSTFSTKELRIWKQRQSFHMSFFHVMHDNLFIIDLLKTRFIFVSYTQSLVVTAPCCCSSQSMSISLYFFIRWSEKRFFFCYIPQQFSIILIVSK